MDSQAIVLNASNDNVTYTSKEVWRGKTVREEGKEVGYRDALALSESFRKKAGKTPEPEKSGNFFRKKAISFKIQGQDGRAK